MYCYVTLLHKNGTTQRYDTKTTQHIHAPARGISRIDIDIDIGIGIDLTNAVDNDACIRRFRSIRFARMYTYFSGVRGQTKLWRAATIRIVIWY